MLIFFWGGAVTIKQFKWDRSFEDFRYETRIDPSAAILLFNMKEIAISNNKTQINNTKQICNNSHWTAVL